MNNNQVQFAFIEANKWRNAYTNLASKNTLLQQAYVLCCFSCELYLKTLLLSEGKQCYGHNLKSLFMKLSTQLQNDIQKNCHFKLQQSSIDMVGQEVKGYVNFQEALEIVTNDFIELRYFYEKFIVGKQVIAYTSFITQLNDTLYCLSRKIVENQVVTE